MRIHYLALHEPSGYATAARRCMRALADAGIELRFVPFLPGSSQGLGYRPASRGEIDDPALTDLLDGPEECDAVVAHLVPEYWPMVRARYPDVPLIGHTVWETDRLPEPWPALLETADLVVVPTACNRDLLERTGIRAPVAVVPHVAAGPARAASDVWGELPDDAFVVYTVAPWTARKALDLTVRAYQRAFAGRDDTVLVIKTSPRDLTYTDARGPGSVAPGTTAWTLARLLGEVAEPAPVRLVTGVLADHDLDALHTRGNCYLSLCRAEGWGIPPFDAGAWGTPVVITGVGGHRAYLDDDSAFLVDHVTVAVDDPAGGGSYTRDQQWAAPSVEHAATLLRQVADDPGRARERAEIARRRILAAFAAPVVARAFIDAISQYTARTNQ